MHSLECQAKGGGCLMEGNKRGRPATGRIHKPLSIAVTDEQLDELKFMAATQDKSVASIVRGMIKNSLLAK